MYRRFRRAPFGVWPPSTASCQEAVLDVHYEEAKTVKRKEV